MPKILVLKKDGSCYIREKSEESKENLDAVAPNKLRTWLAFSNATSKARGKSLEDVVDSVVDEMRGQTFKQPKPKITVSDDEYLSLCIQAANKGVSRDRIEKLIVPLEKTTIEERIEQFIKRRQSTSPQ